MKKTLFSVSMIVWLGVIAVGQVSITSVSQVYSGNQK
jgi:hypothetical protein